MALNSSLFDLVGTIHGVQAWAFDQIRHQLPQSITRFGSRAVTRLAQLDESGDVSAQGVLMRSWFGVEHVVQAHSRAGALPLRLALPKSGVFTRRVGINAAIVSRGEAAITARLARVSPLPERDAVLVWSRAGKTFADQTEMTIWVAHKAEVERAAERAARAASNWEVVSDSALAGVRCPAFASATRSPFAGVMDSALVCGLLVSAVLCSILIAADFRQARALEAAVAAREAMLIRAEHLRDLADIRSDVDAILEVEDEYPRPPTLLRLMREFATSTTSQTEISRMELIDPTTLRVSVADATSASIDINLPGQETPDGP